MKCLLFLILAANLWAESWQLVSVCYTPDSILQKPLDKPPLAVANRFRYASCSDVAWSPDGIYKPFSVLSNPAASLSFPHGLSFSPNGRYLAISNYGDDKITLYEMYP